MRSLFSVILASIVLTYTPIALAEIKAPTIEHYLSDSIDTDSPVQLAISPEQAIQVTKESLPIKSSRLSDQYAAYKVIIQNTWEYPIDIINAQVVGGTGGQQAYAMVKKSSAGVWGSVLGAGFILSIVTFGISFVAALVAWPIIAGVNAGKNGKARKESRRYSDVLPLGVLNTGESAELATLVPINQKPVIKLTFRDMTGNIYSSSR